MAEQTKQPETLSEEVFPGLEEGTEISFDQYLAEVSDSLVLANSLVEGWADRVDAEEAIICHTFLKGVESNAKRTTDALKQRMLDLATDAGGKITLELGEFSGVRVSGSTERVYTDETVNLLESRDLLPLAVTMDASLKGDIAVEDIPAEDWETLHRYFDIELVPSAEKINALVALGKIKATEIDATCEERETRKGHDRLTVKPSANLSEYFHLEK